MTYFDETKPNISLDYIPHSHFYSKFMKALSEVNVFVTNSGPSTTYQKQIS